MSPLPRTSNRASPAVTVAPLLAYPSEKLTGVARSTGEQGEVACWLVVVVGSPAQGFDVPAAAVLAPNRAVLAATDCAEAALASPAAASMTPAPAATILCLIFIRPHLRGDPGPEGGQLPKLG
jgi:hypothetical protein